MTFVFLTCEAVWTFYSFLLVQTFRYYSWFLAEQDDPGRLTVTKRACDFHCLLGRWECCCGRIESLGRCIHVCVHVFMSHNMSCHGKGTINSWGFWLNYQVFWFQDNFTLKCPADVTHRWSLLTFSCCLLPHNCWCILLILQSLLFWWNAV